jgi:hypothetical protein
LRQPSHPSERRYWTRYIERAGDAWIVSDDFNIPKCLGSDGTWSNSDGGGEWDREHLHAFDEAMRLAINAAPSVTYSGVTAVEAAKRWPDQPTEVTP